jgi:hypothetical protein
MPPLPVVITLFPLKEYAISRLYFPNGLFSYFAKCAAAPSIITGKLNEFLIRLIFFKLEISHSY